jgi:hypothetical protein
MESNLMSNTASDPPPPIVPSRERLKLRIGTVFWFVGVIGLALGLPVLFDIGWWAVAVAIVLALILAIPVAWLVRRLFAGQRRQRPVASYLKTAVGVIAVLTILVATPVYALAVYSAARPVALPRAVLSNGKKTVVFQGMVHVGSENFYKSVVYDLEKALTDGYVIFEEGVRGDPAGDAWFSETLAGGGDLSNNYKTLADACGLVFQGDYVTLLGADKAAHPEHYVAADVSTADMMREYERLAQNDPAFAQAVKDTKTPAPKPEQNAGGAGDAAFSLLESASPGQRAIVGLACRGWMTFVLNQKSAPSPLDPVILDFRNKTLADLIATAPQDKIYITYGAHHLPGVIALLKAKDAAWDLQSLTWVRAIEKPGNIEREIE